VSAGEHTYVGSELELFAAARRWKAYLQTQVRPFLGSAVLEVGAGVGATTEALCREQHRRWVCLEPDERLAGEIVDRRERGKIPSCCEVAVGTIETAAPGTFDSIIYIDVLEHIAADEAELRLAASHLAAGGYLVVLSPAHPWLFSPFDRAIGHHRRYTAASLRAITPPGLDLVRLRYLDSLGAMGGALNRLLLRQELPTSRQLALWDRLTIPVSRRVDRLIGYSFGRTLLAVWRVARRKPTADQLHAAPTGNLDRHLPPERTGPTRWEPTMTVIHSAVSSMLRRR
jgi:SAM-dependent methyltransferase